MQSMVTKKNQGSWKKQQIPEQGLGGARAGKVQDEPETSCSTKVIKCSLRQKQTTEASLKELRLNRSGTF